jgi:hypothetical protein
MNINSHSLRTAIYYPEERKKTWRFLGFSNEMLLFLPKAKHLYARERQEPRYFANQIIFKQQPLLYSSTYKIGRKQVIPGALCIIHIHALANLGLKTPPVKSHALKRNYVLFF